MGCVHEHEYEYNKAGEGGAAAGKDHVEMVEGRIAEHRLGCIY